MIRLLLTVFLLTNILLAIECNQKAFELRKDGLAAEMELYDKSIEIAREMYKNNKLMIRKSHYESDMEILETRLIKLNKSKKYLLDAMDINSINTKEWGLLLSICNGKYLEKIQKELVYANNAKEGMKKVEERIDKMINNTKLVIDIGIKKYKSEE